MSESNIFGGKNVNALYTPLSEDEQEVLERLANEGQYKINVVGWGYVDKPQVRFGDARLQFQWKMLFTEPAVHIPVYYFDLELLTHSGIFLLRDQQKITVGSEPVLCGAGVEIGLMWDIQLKQIDPEVVKAIKPGAHGLTSRLGNMKMTQHEKQQLHNLREGEKAVRKMDADEVAKLAEKASGER